VTVVAVGDIAEQLRGVSYSKADATTQEEAGLVPVLRANNISENGLTFDNLVYVPKKYVRPHQYLKQGDVVIAASSGSLDVVGKAGDLRKDFHGSFGAFCKVLRPNQKKVDPVYFSHFFKTATYRGKISSLAAGANINNLKNEHLDDLLIPLPSLDEQKRIAAILDKADQLRQKRRQAIALLDSLTQSIYLEMFGEPASQPWAMATIGEIAIDIRTGPFGSQLLHSEFVDDGIAVLGIDNAVNNRFEWGKARFITKDKYRQLSRYTVKPDDVLITIMGTCGRCAVVPHDIPIAINTKHLCCITLDRSRVLPQYLHACFLNDPGVLRQLGVQAKGAVMPGLNMGIIKSLNIPIPSIALQQIFEQRLSALSQHLIAAEMAAGQSDELFSSLQHRAFAGQL